jgi:hypothetical protein
LTLIGKIVIVNKLIKLNQNAIILKEKGEFEIKSIKKKIFSGRFLTFETNEKEISSEILGQLIMNDVNEISDKFEEVVKLCEFPVDQKWNLIYKASQNGFKSSAFHSKCDGKPNTLVIIKSKNGNIFGGYTKQSWINTDPLSDIDKSDPNAFIFSLINKENRPLKMKCSSNQGIRCNKTLGPIFGVSEGCSDILVGDLYNVGANSFSHFGHYYIHSDYVYKSDKAYSFLPGSFQSKESEIEVFRTN